MVRSDPVSVELYLRLEKTGQGVWARHRTNTRTSEGGPEGRKPRPPGDTNSGRAETDQAGSHQEQPLGTQTAAKPKQTKRETAMGRQGQQNKDNMISAAGDARTQKQKPTRPNPKEEKQRGPNPRKGKPAKSGRRAAQRATSKQKTLPSGSRCQRPPS